LGWVVGWLDLGGFLVFIPTLYYFDLKNLLKIKKVLKCFMQNKIGFTQKNPQPSFDTPLHVYIFPLYATFATCVTCQYIQSIDQMFLAATCNVAGYSDHE
jgi:hypothetical protein